jgi:hypothetical protein
MRVVKSAVDPAETAMHIRDFSSVLLHVGLAHIYDHSGVNRVVYTVAQQELDRRSHDVFLKNLGS